MSYKVELFVSEGDSCPIENWLESLDKTNAARIDARILRFQKGNFGDHKNVGEGIFEARFFFGPGYRMYFGKEKDQIVLLLTGGDKSSQNGDIEIAKKYLKEWRKENA